MWNYAFGSWIACAGILMVGADLTEGAIGFSAGMTACALFNSAFGK